MVIKKKSKIKKRGHNYLPCSYYVNRKHVEPKKRKNDEGQYVPDDPDAIAMIKQKRKNLATHRIKPKPVKKPRKPAQGIWVKKRKNAK